MRAGCVAVALVVVRRAPPPRADRARRARRAADVERAEDAEQQRKHDVARAALRARDRRRAAIRRASAFARREFAETLATWGEIDAAIAQLERAVAARRTTRPRGTTSASSASTQGDVARRARRARARASELAPRDWIRPRVALAALRLEAPATRAARARRVPRDARRSTCPTACARRCSGRSTSSRGADPAIDRRHHRRVVTYSAA